jgi:hypothetical protein
MGRKRKNPADDLPPGFFRRQGSPTIQFWFVDASGKRVKRSSGKTLLAEAQALRNLVQRKIRARVDAGLIAPMSTGWLYAGRWLSERERRNKGSARFHRNNLKHARRLLESLPIEEIERRHVRDLMRDLMAKEELAPRTMLHVYGSLRTMFFDALVDGLITATPCTLKGGERGELPRLEDADLEWRDKAVFTRDEIVQLVTDPRISHVRRMAYALFFLTGMRGGEGVNRRWRDYDAKMEPLGELRLSTAWSHENQREKSPKNKVPRKIPVHPALAAMLAEWKLSGWAREYGRNPTAADFIVAKPWPRDRAGERIGKPAKWKAGERIDNPRTLWKWLNGQWRKGGKRTPGDLELLGLRARRAYDARRTFITLAVADGAREVVLRHITHGRPRKTAFDLYPSFPWETQCEEVKKLRLGLQPKAERSQ